MTVRLTDEEAESISDLLEILSQVPEGCGPDDTPTGMNRSAAETYKYKLRKLADDEVGWLTEYFTLVYHAGESVEKSDGSTARYPEVILTELPPEDVTDSDLYNAAEKVLRREGYDPDQFGDQLERRIEHWPRKGDP